MKYIVSLTSCDVVCMGQMYEDSIAGACIIYSIPYNFSPREWRDTRKVIWLQAVCLE